MIIVTTGLTAQRNGNSPYSRFGIGDINDNSFMHLRQMAGISSSYIDGFHINTVNPASYAFLSSTAFDIGIAAKRSKLSDGEATSEPIWSGNMDYLSLAFPLQNDLNQLLDRKYSPYRFGMAFALAPVSTVAYNIESTTIDPEDGEIVRNYNGKGGSSKFLWGLGFKYNDFAIGTNLGYQFGNISYERRLEFREVAFAYNDIFTTSYSMGGFLWDIGLIYHLTLNKKQQESDKKVRSKSLTFGLTYSKATTLSTIAEVSQIAIQSGVGAIDTGFIASDIEGEAKVPATLGLGVTYRLGNQFVIGLDYKTTNWSSYYNEATGEVKETLKNTSSVSIGGYYRPNYKSYTSYWNRVYYRYGIYTRTDPREIDGVQINSYGVTMGLGMPFVFQRKVSHANLGFEIGKRGGDTPISETYCKFTLGFTFNDDSWFLKRKYN